MNFSLSDSSNEDEKLHCNEESIETEKSREYYKQKRIILTIKS